MSNPIERIYNGSDAFMLESADTMQASFVLDQAEFEAFDTQLTVGFGTDWKNAIDVAYAEEGDNTVVAPNKNSKQFIHLRLVDKIILLNCGSN